MNDQLGNETEHAKRENEKKYDSAGLSRLRLPCYFANDEKHVEHEGADPERHAEIRNLLFSQSKHLRVFLLVLALATGHISGNAHAQRIKLDETSGVLLVIGAGIVLKACNSGIKQ